MWLKQLLKNELKKIYKEFPKTQVVEVGVAVEVREAADRVDDGQQIDLGGVLAATDSIRAQEAVECENNNYVSVYIFASNSLFYVYVEWTVVIPVIYLFSATTVKKVVAI